MSRSPKIWLQLAYLMQTEADALAYKYPRDPADANEIAMCTAASQRFYDKAGEVAGPLSDDAWRDAVEALGAA